MTIEKYIAQNNPREVAAILEANGSRKINKDNIEDVLMRFTDKKGDSAYEQLALIDTPYRRLILSSIMEEKKSGCSGCDGGCECEKKKSNTEGNGKVILTTDKDPNYIVPPAPIVVAPLELEAKRIVSAASQNLMIIGVVLLGVLTIATMVRK